ncbi:MAG: Cell-division-associated, ABC-transporter-like signaling protein FtsE, partial [uncultured Rubrobacteraceae bacterium]
AGAQPRGRPAGPRSRRGRVPRGLEDVRVRRHGPRGRLLLDPARGVRLPRRPDGLGQVDDHAAPHQGARAVRGRDRRGGPRAGLHHPPQGPVLPPQPRRGLPGLQAPAQPHGVRQRRLRAAGHGPLAQGHPREGPRHPAPDGPGHEAALLPRPALGRRAAARGGRPGVRQPPAAPARRRADGQPRSRDLRRDHAAPVPHQPHGDDGHRRHPRRRHGRPDAPARHRGPRGPRHPRRGRRGLRAPAPARGRPGLPLRRRLPGM